MKAIFSLVLLSLLLQRPVQAVGSPLNLDEWQVQGPAKMRLVVGRLPNQLAAFGLEMQLEPGWRTYWKYPGSSGIAPVLNWAGSAHFKVMPPVFETPMRFEDPAGDYFGYEVGTLISIPLQLLQTELLPNPKPAKVEDSHTETKPPSLRGEEANNYTGVPLKSDSVLEVQLSVDIGICQSVCLPLSFNFAGTLTPDQFASSQSQAVFERHLKALPKPANETLYIDNLTFDGVSLNMVVLGTELLDPEIIIAGGPLDAFESPIYLGRDETAYLISIPAWAGLDAPFIGRELEVIIVNGPYAVSQKITVQKP